MIIYGEEVEGLAIIYGEEVESEPGDYIWRGGRESAGYI